MIVVSNTSPLTNLAAIGQFDLLHVLYGNIYVPTGVREELSAQGKIWPGRTEVEKAEWIVVEPVASRTIVTLLCMDLDRGEAETIALALEMNADLTILDEREGRRVAERLGLKVTGVVGLLIAAKARGRIKSVRPWLDALRNRAGFYLSDSVYQHALNLAGE